MAHQIAVQSGKATGRKFSMIVDYSLHASIPHYVNGLTISGPKLDLWSMGMIIQPKLYALFQAILSLSHGNAYPERGFSVNKQLLQSHGYIMKEKSIVSLQLLKDELIRAGGVLKFPCTIELINFIKNAPVKYFADIELQKLTVEKEKRQKILRVESQEVDESNKKKACRSWIREWKTSK